MTKASQSTICWVNSGPTENVANRVSQPVSQQQTTISHSERQRKQQQQHQHILLVFSTKCKKNPHAQRAARSLWHIHLSHIVQWLNSNEL